MVRWPTTYSGPVHSDKCSDNSRRSGWQYRSHTYKSVFFHPLANRIFRWIYSVIEEREATMGKCRFSITPNLQCGMDATGILCPLHALEEVRDSSINILTDYIEKSPSLHGDVLYLTDLTFYGLNWEIILGDYHGEAYFSGSTFICCKFRSIIFGAPVQFAATIFINTGFEVVSFQSGANFSLARFDGDKTPFSWCTFKTEVWGGEGEPIDVIFERAIFLGSATVFDVCSFVGRLISFKEADFECDRLQFYVHDRQIDVYDRFLLISAEEIIFTGIGHTGHLEYIQDTKSKDHAPRVDFQSVMFPQMKSVAFFRANLSRTRFTESIIDNVNFINCHWGHKPDKNGRKAVYDDISRADVVGKEELRRQNEELLRQYIQLKKNFENQKDFVGAGDWSYREMKCRENIATKWTYRPALWLYRISSHYGENMYVPLFWLFGIWVVAALSYLMFGIPLDPCGHSELNYDWGSGGSFQWADICTALGFSFAAMTLQLGKSISIVGWDGMYIYVPHLLLTATLVSLFLLAVRRKFRR